MIVDFHAHLWGKGFIPPSFYKESARQWAEKASDRTPEMILPRLLEGVVDEDGKLFVENMGRAGVDLTVINMSDMGIYRSGEEPEVPVEKQLEFYGELQTKYPERFRFFFFADPRRKNGVELLEKAVKKYGFVGCGEFTSETLYVTDEVVQPMVRKCVELAIPIFVHTRAGHGMAMTGNDYTVKAKGHPFHIKALQARYPDLVIVVGHSGFPLWWEEACRIARGNPNSYLDLSNWDSELSQPEHFIPKLACMRDMVGADHLLFASDQASGKRFCGERSNLPHWVNFFKNLPEEARRVGYQFTKEEAELILGGNAQRILRLHF